MRLPLRNAFVFTMRSATECIRVSFFLPLAFLLLLILIALFHNPFWRSCLLQASAILEKLSNILYFELRCFSSRDFHWIMKQDEITTWNLAILDRLQSVNVTWLLCELWLMKNKRNLITFCKILWDRLMNFRKIRIMLKRQKIAHVQLIYVKKSI